MSLDHEITCLSSSFSAFISLSIFLTSASCACFFTRVAYEVWPAVGLKGFFFSCQCFPFLRKPVICGILAILSPIGAEPTAVGIFHPVRTVGAIETLHVVEILNSVPAAEAPSQLHTILPIRIRVFDKTQLQTLASAAR